ncbi:MAG TPA: hypothetical protein VF796_18490, partial [Humisphaera sp.]
FAATDVALAGTLTAAAAVGAGVAAPQYKLHVQGAPAEQTPAQERLVYLHQPYHAGASFQHAAAIALGGTPANPAFFSAMHLQVCTAAVSDPPTLTTLLTLDGESQAVGIGTTAPTSRLHVAGTVAATGFRLTATGGTPAAIGAVTSPTASRGASGTTVTLADPDAWIPIEFNGTTYLVPAYLPA